MSDWEKDEKRTSWAYEDAMQMVGYHLGPTKFIQISDLDDDRDLGQDFQKRSGAYNLGVRVCDTDKYGMKYASHITIRSSRPRSGNLTERHKMAEGHIQGGWFAWGSFTQKKIQRWALIDYTKEGCLEWLVGRIDEEVKAGREKATRKYDAKFVMITLAEIQKNGFLTKWWDDNEKVRFDGDDPKRRRQMGW